MGRPRTHHGRRGAARSKAAAKKGVDDDGEGKSEAEFQKESRERQRELGKKCGEGLQRLHTLQQDKEEALRHMLKVRKDAFLGLFLT